MRVWTEVPVSDECYALTEELARRRGISLDECHQELLTEAFEKLLQATRSARPAAGGNV